MKVIISVTRRVRFSSIVEISEADFKRIDKALENGNYAESRDAEKELNEMIDVSDWQDDSFDSLDDFRSHVDEA